MTKHILLLLTLFICCETSYARVPQDTLLDALYTFIANKEMYMSEKNRKIGEIKHMLETPHISPEQRYDIHLRLQDEYKTYLSDSAIHYIRENTQIALQLNDTYRIYESKLDLAALYITAGMYIESLEILKTICAAQLPVELQVKYYNGYKLLYNHYSYTNPYTYIYTETSDLYRDSLLQVLDPASNHYQIVYAEKLEDAYQLKEARDILQPILDPLSQDTHEKAVVAYALANTYKKEGNIRLQKHYYALSAICDIKNAIKENASMRALASVLYETGEVDKAYECIKSSMEDAMFCNARFRTYEVSQIFPIIQTAYQEKADKQKSDLQFFLILVSILSAFLIAAVIYVYRQMKRVARIRTELSRANDNLSVLNHDLQSTVDQLNQANQRLSEVNTELSEANQTKEAYIGHSLDLCSTYIDKLEKYQNTLHKKAIEKKFDELHKILRSRQMIDHELKELYDNFDHIFLHLYPNFVEEFNSLLLEEERFVLKSNELLNVELRIFALIHLGITDSSRIANFLHYSANTIYSYRTRVRNKVAVPREEFESMVMKIGVIRKD